MKLNHKEIQNKREELESYKGYLPSLIQMEIDYDNYIEFLKKEGLFDDLMIQLSKSRHFSRPKRESELKNWVNEHPEYSDFIID